MYLSVNTYYVHTHTEVWGHGSSKYWGFLLCRVGIIGRYFWDYISYGVGSGNFVKLRALRMIFLELPIASLSLFFQDLSIEEQSECTQDFYQNVAERMQTRGKGNALFASCKGIAGNCTESDCSVRAFSLSDGLTGLPTPSCKQLHRHAGDWSCPERAFECHQCHSKVITAVG